MQKKELVKVVSTGVESSNNKLLKIERDLPQVIEELKSEIKSSTSMPQLKELKNKAKAWEEYYKASGFGLEAQNLGAEIKLRAERKMGELLPKLIQHGGDKASRLQNETLLLEDLGISKSQSFRYKQLNQISDKEFEKFFSDLRARFMEITTAGLINLLKGTEKNKRIEEESRDRIKRISGLEIRKGDFNEVLKDVYNIDAIITDPPYPFEFIDCFSELAIFAKEHLKKDGFIAIYSGQYHLPEVIKRLSEHLTYVWTFCLYHTGKKQLVNGVNIMCGWKPVLIFSNGKKKMRFSAYDVLVSEEREKFGHEWQQSESGVYSLIDIFTKPGELVVDPFSGAGTFGKVAIENGRKFIGAEIK